METEMEMEIEGDGDGNVKVLYISGFLRLFLVQFWSMVAGPDSAAACT